MSDQTSPFESMELKREYLHEQIADSIQRMIAEKQLQIGTQLPSERDLSVMLGVSRATVREATRLLQERGLVEMKLGSGTYVTDIRGRVVADTIDRYLTFGTSSHEDLITFREMLEPEIAALAAERGAPGDMEPAKKLVDEMEDEFARDDIEHFPEADASFHELIAVATHNELVIAVARGLRGVMEAWFRAQHMKKRRAEGVAGHRRILDAIVMRDPNRAREEMRGHLAITRELYLGAGEARSVVPVGDR